MARPGYERLMVRQKADELAYQVYTATKTFPKEELYAMTSQLRRAALSVPTNIVEGYARQGRNEFRQFANIALGSLAETKYLLGFCLRLKYLKQEEYKRLEALADDTGRLLWRFYESLGKGRSDKGKAIGDKAQVISKASVRD
jgi:four helix bundle protein